MLCSSCVMAADTVHTACRREQCTCSNTPVYLNMNEEAGINNNAYHSTNFQCDYYMTMCMSTARCAVEHESRERLHSSRTLG